MTDTPATKKTTAKKTTANPSRAKAEAPPLRNTSDPWVLISEPQMRRLHALLHTRLRLTERADILDYLSVALGRTVETRKDLSQDEAQRVIDGLADLPVAGPTDEDWQALRAPFSDAEIGQLPRSTCRACSRSERRRCDQHQWISNCHVCHGNHSSATIHLSYVGHADVTARLLAVDPNWTWEPMSPGDLVRGLDPNGGLWIRLTVLGVTRPGYGSADGKTGGNAVKEAIGDALRNAAMRFGVALDLWAKGDREWAHAVKDEVDPPPSPPERPEIGPSIVTPVEEWDGPVKGESLLRIDELGSRLGMDRGQVTAKWRASHGDLPVDRLVDVPASVLYDLANTIERYVNTMREAAAK